MQIVKEFNFLLNKKSPDNSEMSDFCDPSSTRATEAGVGAASSDVPNSRGRRRTSMPPQHRDPYQSGAQNSADGRRLTLHQMNTIAVGRGGVCLSTVYVNSRTKLHWQCLHGHTFEMTPNDVKNHRHWCPRCIGNARLSIEDMQSLAESKGGLCLSDVYRNTETKLEWKCSEGHAFLMRPMNVKQGQWCPTCSGKAKLTLNQMQEIAESKGGRCLSTSYQNSRAKLLWKCAGGHEFEMSPNDVKNHGHWCPSCAGRRRSMCRSPLQDSAERIDSPIQQTPPTTLRTSSRRKSVQSDASVVELSETCGMETSDYDGFSSDQGCGGGGGGSGTECTSSPRRHSTNVGCSPDTADVPQSLNNLNGIPTDPIPGECGPNSYSLRSRTDVPVHIIQSSPNTDVDNSSHYRFASVDRRFQSGGDLSKRVADEGSSSVPRFTDSSHQPPSFISVPRSRDFLYGKDTFRCGESTNDRTPVEIPAECRYLTQHGALPSTRAHTRFEGLNSQTDHVSVAQNTEVCDPSIAGTAGSGSPNSRSASVTLDPFSGPSSGQWASSGPYHGKVPSAPVDQFQEGWTGRTAFAPGSRFSTSSHFPPVAAGEVSGPSNGCTSLFSNTSTPSPSPVMKSYELIEYQNCLHPNVSIAPILPPSTGQASDSQLLQESSPPSGSAVSPAGLPARLQFKSDRRSAFIPFDSASKKRKSSNGSSTGSAASSESPQGSPSLSSIPVQYSGIGERSSALSACRLYYPRTFQMVPFVNSTVPIGYGPAESSPTMHGVSAVPFPMNALSLPPRQNYGSIENKFSPTLLTPHADHRTSATASNIPMSVVPNATMFGGMNLPPGQPVASSNPQSQYSSNISSANSFLFSYPPSPALLPSSFAGNVFPSNTLAHATPSIPILNGSMASATYPFCFPTGLMSASSSSSSSSSMTSSGSSFGTGPSPHQLHSIGGRKQF